MSEKAQFGAELVLDDHATEKLHHIKEGFAEVGEKVSEVQRELRGFAIAGVGALLGVSLTNGIDSIKEFAEEFVHAAATAQNEQRQLANLLAVNDRTGASFEELGEKAKELHEHLEGVGVQAGVTSASLVDAYEMIASRSKKSADQVLHLTEQMAMAGKALPGGAQQLAGAFRDLESGIVRPRNELVKFLIQTHTVEGSAKNVARSLSQMMQTGQEGRVFELAEKAIGKMAEKMKDVPLTFDQTVVALGNVREQIYKAVGDPMVRALLPPLEHLRGYFEQHREEVEHWANVVGTQAGVWITDAADKFREGFEYLQTHEKEIAAGLKEAAHDIKAAFQFVVDHKDAIMMALRVNMGAKLLAPGLGALGSVGKFVGGAGAAEGAAAEGAAGGLGLAAMGATVAGAAAFTAAVGFVGAALYTGGKALDEMGSNAADLEMSLNALKRDALEGATDQAKQMRDAVVILNPQLAAMADLLVQQASASAAYNAGFENDAAKAVEDAYDPYKTGGADELVKLYEQAAAHHNEGQKKLIASLMAATPEVVEGFAFLSSSLTGSAKALAETLKMVDPQLAKQLTDQLGFMGPKGDGVKGDHPMNFYGGIHIKQDYRDQDPDRIAMVFQRDLGAAAVNRMGAKTAKFGGFGG